MQTYLLFFIQFFIFYFILMPTYLLFFIKFFIFYFNANLPFIFLFFFFRLFWCYRCNFMLLPNYFTTYTEENNMFQWYIYKIICIYIYICLHVHIKQCVSHKNMFQCSWKWRNCDFFFFFFVKYLCILFTYCRVHFSKIHGII